MPYIPQKERERYVAQIAYLADMMKKEPGHLNYIITKIIGGYAGDAPNYQTYNDIIGVLECAKQEIYRRQIAPYEESKIAANGDV